MGKLLKSNIKYFWYPIFLKYLDKVIIDINLLGKYLKHWANVEDVWGGLKYLH